MMNPPLNEKKKKKTAATKPLPLKCHTARNLEN